MTDPTPSGEPERGPVPDAHTGATRAPLAEGEEPDPSRLERAKSAYELISDVITPQTLFILLAAAIIGITGLLGGWNNIATVDKQLPELHVGEQVRSQPLELTVTGARVVSDFQPLTLTSYGKYRFVLVALVAKNVSDKTISASEVAKTLVLDTGAGEDERPAVPTLYRVSDTAVAGQLQPGLAARYVTVYQQSVDDPVPTELTFRIDHHTYRQSSISGEYNWTDAEPAYTLTVPVTQEQP